MTTVDDNERVPHTHTHPPPVEPLEPTPQRRLRRSRTDRVVAGVAGGIGHYLGIDPVLVRLAFVALTLASGLGILLYIIAWIIIPEERPGETVAEPTGPAAGSLRVVVGGALLAVGVILLVERLVPWLDSGVIWGLAILVIGILLLVQGLRR